MRKNVIIIGSTASGKDYLRSLLEKDGYIHWKTRTTRPKRPNESDTHKFVSNIDKSTCVTYSEYTLADGTDVAYALDVVDLLRCDASKPLVVIANPSEVEVIREAIEPSITVYLHVEQDTLLYRLAKRGDDPKEAWRRIVSDAADFDRFKVTDIIAFPDAESAFEYLSANMSK